MERFKQKLQAAAIPFRENEPLAAHCTFKIGGPAQLFVMPENEQQLCSAVALCKEQAVRYYLLGNGSNILFADEGFSGVVIDVSALDAEIAVEDTVLTAGAGVRLAALCKAALKHGLSGLEFAYGIPGTVGGAVYMNAGAYGGEMKDVLTTVRYLAAEGEVREVPAAELDLRYRHSIFEENSILRHGKDSRSESVVTDSYICRPNMGYILRLKDIRVSSLNFLKICLQNGPCFYAQRFVFDQIIRILALLNCHFQCSLYCIFCLL